MTRNFEECFEELESTEESAAEVIHCLKKHGEQVLYDHDGKRLKLGRELFDTKYEDEMKKISELLKIESLEDYEKMDVKYNLTMY